MLRCCVLSILVALATANIIPRSYQCGNQSFYTADNDIIRSHSGFDLGHDYGKNLDCVWTIEAPAGKMVELVANSFHVEPSHGSCSYDYLELFDGDTTNGQSLGKFCGDTFAPISSTQRFLTLNFVTDASHGYRGFELFYNFTDHVIRTCLQDQFLCSNVHCVPNRYRCDGQDDCGDDSDEKGCQYVSTQPSCGADDFHCQSGRCVSGRWVCDGDNDCGDMSDEANCTCGQTNFTGVTGNISSPNFPLSYPRNTHCIYHVTAQAGTKSIAFTFNAPFQLETSSNGSCTLDNVTVSGTHGRQLHGPFCGDTKPSPFEIHGNEAEVRFNSDGSVQGIGFMLTWSATG